MTYPVFQLPVGPIQTNCYLVADEVSKSAALIDPGGDAPRLLTMLAERQWRLNYILLTHAHFDHIGGVAEVKQATQALLAVHPLELPLLRQQGGAAAFGLHIRPCPAPEVLLEPGQVIEVGSLRFTVLFVPGHTRGHVAFYEPTLQAVFSGDVLFQDGIGRTDFPGGDYATLMRSIHDVLLTLPNETAVYSGHGPATTVGDEKKNNPFLAE